MFRNIVTNKVFFPFILLTSTFIVYFNILPNQLFFDDEELIYKNKYIQNLNYFPNYFTENMTAGAGKVSNMYRPILLTSFALDYQIWKNNPLGYHLTSIFLHAANGILIFFFINMLFQNKLLSFITSLLFIVHPIQTEAVTYASGRTDPLSSFFTLLSLILFLKINKKKGKYSLNKLFYSGSLVFFVLAILSKETAVILPLLLIIVIFTRKAKLDSHKIFLLFPFFFLDLIYLALRLTLLNFSNTLNFYELPNVYSTSFLVRIFTFSRVFFEYLSLLIFPKDLIFARDIRYITSVSNPWVIGFIAFVTFFFVFPIKFFKKNKLFLFSFLWFFCTLTPTSGIIPINNIMAEHYLYLPSLSFFLIVAYFFSKLINSPNLASKIFSFVFLVFFITALSLRTIIRNFDWKDALTFYTKSLTQSPWHIPMRHNLAMTLSEMGEYEIAIKEYQMIISHNDVYPQTHHNLANLYKTLKRYKEAEKEYQAALKIDPRFYFSYFGLLDLYQKSGEKEKLEKVQKIIQELKIFP